ncbi:MAG: AAA family ATPase [Rubrobacter sp.]|nr:AAA family ATPase [Rubrobacter sp.]
MIRDRTEELVRLHFEHAPREESSFAANGHRSSPPSGATPKSDEEVIEKIRAERNGKFERLWRGDLSDYEGDHSSADDGFVHKLWSYTQDAEQVKRIHAMSALHRPEKSGRRADYLDRSINRAAKNVAWFYEWSDETVISIGENGRRNGHKEVSSLSSPYIGSDSDDTKREPLRAVPFCEMGEPVQHEEILAGLVPEKYPAVWYGDGGSAKSMLALSFGVAVAGDARTWLGRAVSTAPVLYADFELDAEEQNRRVRRIVRGAGLARPPKGLLYLPALGYGPVEALRAAYAECSKRGVGLLIMDSFGPALQGDSEAARDIIGFFGKVLEPFRALGVAVLIIDHQARAQAGERYQNKSAFGSVYKTNLTRSVVQIEATERGEDYVALRLRQKKHNFGALADPFGAKIAFGDSVVVEAQDLDEADLAEEGTLNATDRVKHALQREPAYPHELAERTGLALGTAKNALTKLRKAGAVEPTGERQGQAEQVRLASSLSSPYIDSDSDDASHGLSVSEVAAEMSRSESGPALALGTYLEKPTEERLEWLTKAVLKVRGMDTTDWKRHAEAVRAAAEDPNNHPLDCGCEECA